MTPTRAGPPGPAFIALVAIVAIAAAWWALALWPASTGEPEWVSRTRAVCFGARPGGLPDAGGWILLIGEPAGMIGVLIAVWGRSLGAELRRMRAHPVWRILGGSLVVVVMVAIVALGVRVTRAYASSRTPATSFAGLTTRVDVDAPVISLTDQHGRRVSLGEFRGRPLLVTFAFGHCATVCPTIVRDVMAARREAERGEVPLVVVTLDPWRDTPDRLPSIASHWELGPRDHVLSGSVGEVEAALDALGVGRRRNTTTGDVEHAGTVLLIDAHGKVSSRLDGAPGRVGELLAR